MSRVCVKNLPKYVAEDNLRDFFSQKGEVTDAKLMRTKDGKSRQFAFIGYRTEEQAQEALKYFNNSYMDTSRITCELAYKVKDPNIPPAWSRYSVAKKDSLNKEKTKESDVKSSRLDHSKGVQKNSKKRNEVNDPDLEEFIKVMQPRSKTKLWTNDTMGNSLPDHKSESREESHLKKGDGKQSVPVKLDEHDEKENEASDSKPPKKLKDLAHNEDLTDMDYIKSRVKKDWSDSDSDSESEEHSVSESLGGRVVDAEEHHDVLHRESPQEDIIKEGISEASAGGFIDSECPSSALANEKKQVLETGRLFVRNLPYTATEEDLAEVFNKFGDVSGVHLVVDKDTKRSKGIAFVHYSLPESAVRALEELDNSIFQGRLLHILPAEQQKASIQRESDSSTQVTKTFKQQKEEQRKASASGDTRPGSVFFMHPDTVVENLARKYGVSKSDLLAREADDLAVRIALGEAQVIAETKKAFINAGVNIAALEDLAAGKSEGLKRSNHVVLVKNLSYGSSEVELSMMFGKFGSLEKIIFPPTRTMALVVFLEAAEARAAFKGLAYKRYKDGPLYLEWAPSNILCPSSTLAADAQKDVVVGEKDVKKVFLEQQVAGISDVDIDPDRVESRSLFVKNLNFRTSDEGLRKHFNEIVKEGRIQSVKIKKHLKNGKNVSMGFGFIEFDSVETAANVCRDLQGTVLDGHALILQLCHAKKDEPMLKKVDKDRSSTKLIVRNVAFEATEKDLRQLFSPFGQVKSLRLPMKFGNHRGFAFVEFVTKQEAQNALQALSSTHLYGRHLVLERAKEGESLEELRARTAAQFTDEQNGYQNPTKLSKKRKQMDFLDEGSARFESMD